MPTIEETINTLKDMGFTEAQAKKALNKTGWSGIEAAAEWLLSHPGDDGTEDASEEPAASEEGEGTTEAPTLKILTEEERQAQLKKVEELRVKKRLEREEREKKEALEREKKRIEDGKQISSMKQQMQEKEIKKIAEDRVREKKENQLAKERVKAQIEQDKRDRKEREAKSRGEAPAASPSASQPPPSAAIPSNTPAKDYSETKIQIRQLDGKPIVQTFKSKESLSAVRLYVQLNRQDQPGVTPKLMTNFPKKLFQEDDYDTPLEALGLVPSAVLMISQN